MSIWLYVPFGNLLLTGMDASFSLVAWETSSSVLLSTEIEINLHFLSPEKNCKEEMEQMI